METSNTTHTTVRDSVLSRIDAEHIAPKPAWHFLLKEWVIWVVAGCSFLLGTAATTLSEYIVHTSLFMEYQLEQSPLDRFVELVPLFWLVLVAIAIFYAVHAVRETRRGYRYSPAWLVVGALGLSVLFGTIAEARGIGKIIDDYLLETVPAYQPLSGFRPQRFMDPEQGVHAGTIISVDDGSVIIETLKREALEVMITPRTEMHQRVILNEGMPIRVVGTTTHIDDTDQFEGLRIEPFRGRGASVPGKGLKRGRYLEVKEGQGLMRSTLQTDRN